MSDSCPLCRCPPPAHNFGCWYLVSPLPAAQVATDASVTLMVDVYLAHALESTELHRLALMCKDPTVRRLLLARSVAHDKLSTVKGAAD